MDYASWITAVSALVQAVAAVVLYGVTRRTLSVNEELAKVAADQLAHERERDLERRERNKKSLRAISERLLRIVSDLPDREGAGADSSLRASVSWSQADISSIERLSLDVDAADALTAATTRLRLEYLLEQIRAVQAVKKSIGFDYSEFPWDRFASDRSALLAELSALQSGR
jgi:hypothetical protein